MANRRMISSDIWEDDWFGQLDFFQQALWIGLFSKCADDQGRLLNNPVLLRAAIFPYKDVALADIAQAVAEFAQAGRVILYNADGKNLLQIVNWWEHQRPQWAQPSKFPAPDEWKDRVRTRDGGVYKVENWREPRAMAPEGTRLSDKVVRQSHVPVPDPVPDPKKTTAVSPPAAPAPAKKASVDPRKYHPAIKAVFDASNTHVPKVLYDKVIGVLGDTPDVVRLKNCVETWVGKGWKPTNYAWIFEWYAKGGPPQNNGNGHGPPRAPGETYDKNRAMLAKMMEEAHDGKP